MAAARRRDAELAQEVQAMDEDVDRREINLEEECLKTLALHQPVAINLRQLIAALKINNDLERIGDMAVNIARKAAALAVEAAVEIPADFADMGEQTQAMLRKSLDSLVQMDEAQEKQDRMEFLSAVGAFLEKTMQAATQTPAMGPILGELFKFGITGFRVGKTIEGALDNAIDLLRKNAGAPPPPNPAMVKAQAETQAHSQQQQVELQADQQRTQMELAADKQREQLKVWADQQRDAAEAHRNALQSAMEARLEQQRMAQERWQERTHQMLEFVLARLDRATRLEVAEIGKETTLAGAQISAANAAQQGGNDAAVPGQV